MTQVGPLFLAAVLAETFEEYHSDDAIAHEAGRLLHEALARHGYELAAIGDGTERARLNTATTGLVRRFADAMGHYAADMDRVARAMSALDVGPDETRRVEDAAWGTIWLHGDWRYLTGKMTTGERVAAADAVQRDWDFAEGEDPTLTHGADTMAKLRWWTA